MSPKLHQSERTFLKIQFFNPCLSPLFLKPIDLGSYDTFEKKLNVLYEYAAIRNIFVEVSNYQDIQAINPVPLHVTQLKAIRGCILCNGSIKRMLYYLI